LAGTLLQIQIIPSLIIRIFGVMDQRWIVRSELIGRGKARLMFHLKISLNTISGQEIPLSTTWHSRQAMKIPRLGFP